MPRYILLRTHRPLYLRRLRDPLDRLLLRAILWIGLVAWMCALAWCISYR